MYRLRCTVSGGLEAFAEEEVSEIFPNDKVQLEWHHRGHSGSLLELGVDDPSRHFFLNEVIHPLVGKLRFIDHVSMHVLRQELPSQDDLNVCEWITDQCLINLNDDDLATAKEAWILCKTTLDQAMSSRQLEGELITLPTLHETTTEEVNTRAQTESFHVNTIYTKCTVAKPVVSLFLELVQKELKESAMGGILWLDAGAGSGGLLQQLPPNTSFGFDLEPRHERVHRKDFLKLNKEWLQSLFPNYQTLCIISNPPFVQGSRGDYTIIAQFLQHAMHLNANFMGLIVPTKFARAWKSFGLPIQLLYRSLLPKDSFYDPSTGESKHVQCFFLFFDLQPTKTHNTSNPQDTLTPTIHVVAQRDKGKHPSISTDQLTTAVVHGLRRGGVPLGSSKTSSMTLRAKLGSHLELFLELNPKRPLSLANSMSRQVESHSLGWMAKSVKPPVALAMNYLGQYGSVTKTCAVNGLTVNLMCGEGTLDYEALLGSFHMVGDKNADSLALVKTQVEKLPQTIPPMDFILWDAQNLPFRQGIADCILADLPFAGSQKKKHQEPSADKKFNQEVALRYPKILASTVRALVPATGRAVLVSADSKAMTHGIRRYAGHLKELWHTKLNIGGLAGRMALLVRKDSSWKDVNLTVEDAEANHSHELWEKAAAACSEYFLDDLLQLQEGNGTRGHLVSCVKYQNQYRHQDQRVSHCYRFHFHPLISNTQAKALEKAIRAALQDSPIAGAKLG